MNKPRGMNGPGGEEWPSKVLHDVGGGFEGGLNRARLRALADFIEGLPITWRGARHPGPVPSIQSLEARVACIGFVLHAGGPGFGLVAYSAPAPHGAVMGYHLTGYGVICWAWGASNGMSSVAGNGLVNGLQSVLTAEPIERGAVPDLSLPDVTPAHVAAALRAFVECEDAEDAWRAAAGEPADRPAQAQAPAAPGEARAAHGREAALTDSERFKQLFVRDRYDEAEALCERRVADLEAQAARIADEAATWRKRLNAVRAMR